MKLNFDPKAKTKKKQSAIAPNFKKLADMLASKGSK